MQIDDPMDAVDITEHQDLYKYDYINEEISQKASEAEAGADGVTITLYFADDEEGQKPSCRSGKSSFQECRGFLSGLRRQVTTANGLYKWQEHFKPSKVGERIVVKPGWENYEVCRGRARDRDGSAWRLEAAFMKRHPWWLKALEKDLGGAYDPSRYPIKVLDVGTGTGILAMAAVLLGADEALGIDIDDEAVRVANENIAKNGLEGRISIQRGNLMDGHRLRSGYYSCKILWLIL